MVLENENLFFEKLENDGAARNSPLPAENGIEGFCNYLE